MNKTFILNFLNEFRELFDHGICDKIYEELESMMFLWYAYVSYDVVFY